MVTGGCLCGGVRFEIRGRLTPLQLCHATRCQRATGSAFAPEVAALPSAFRWTCGEELISSYDAPLLSEPPASRGAVAGSAREALDDARRRGMLKAVVIVAWVFGVASFFVVPEGNAAQVGRWLFAFLAVVHGVECLVFLPRLRQAGGSLPSQLARTFVFGVVHVRELGAQPSPNR